MTHPLILSTDNFSPAIFLLLKDEIPFLETCYDSFLLGSLSWDDMLITCYEGFKKECISYPHCHPAIIVMPEFTSPLDLSDQTLIIACIVGCIFFMENDVRPLMENQKKQSEMN